MNAPKKENWCGFCFNKFNTSQDLQEHLISEHLHVTDNISQKSSSIPAPNSVSQSASIFSKLPSILPQFTKLPTIDPPVLLPPNPTQIQTPQRTLSTHELNMSIKPDIQGDNKTISLPYIGTPCVPLTIPPQVPYHQQLIESEEQDFMNNTEILSKMQEMSQKQFKSTYLKLENSEIQRDIDRARHDDIKQTIVNQHEKHQQQLGYIEKSLSDIKYQQIMQYNELMRHNQHQRQQPIVIKVDNPSSGSQPLINQVLPSQSTPSFIPFPYPNAPYPFYPGFPNMSAQQTATTNNNTNPTPPKTTNDFLNIAFNEDKDFKPYKKKLDLATIDNLYTGDVADYEQNPYKQLLCGYSSDPSNFEDAPVYTGQPFGIYIDGIRSLPDSCCFTVIKLSVEPIIESYSHNEIKAFQNFSSYRFDGRYSIINENSNNISSCSIIQRDHIANMNAYVCIKVYTVVTNAPEPRLAFIGLSAFPLFYNSTTRSDAGMNDANCLLKLGSFQIPLLYSDDFLPSNSQKIMVNSNPYIPLTRILIRIENGHNIISPPPLLDPSTNEPNYKLLRPYTPEERNIDETRKIRRNRLVLEEVKLLMSKLWVQDPMTTINNVYRLFEPRSPNYIGQSEGSDIITRYESIFSVNPICYHTDESKCPYMVDITFVNPKLPFNKKELVFNQFFYSTIDITCAKTGLIFYKKVDNLTDCKYLCSENLSNLVLIFRIFQVIIQNTNEYSFLQKGFSFLKPFPETYLKNNTAYILNGRFLLNVYRGQISLSNIDYILRNPIQNGVEFKFGSFGAKRLTKSFLDVAIYNSDCQTMIPDQLYILPIRKIYSTIDEGVEIAENPDCTTSQLLTSITPYLEPTNAALLQAFMLKSGQTPIK